MGKKVKIKARKLSRECFMQLLYEMEIQQDYSLNIKQKFMERLKLLRSYGEDGSDLTNGLDSTYIDKMFGIITDHLADIDKLLEDSSRNWKIGRIDKVDLAIIRLSVAELVYLDDIPDSVSINEAVELAKKFGSEESSRFVNGILGKISRQKNEGR